MASAVRNARRLLDLGLEDAIAMATAFPAAFLGLKDLGVITRGATASLLVLEQGLTVAQCWINGRRWS